MERRQPALGVLGEDEPVIRTPRRTAAQPRCSCGRCWRRPARRCSGLRQTELSRRAGRHPPSARSAQRSPSATPTPARAVPSPRNRACYDYRYRAAIAPVAHGDPVPCDVRHTAITFTRRRARHRRRRPPGLGRLRPSARTDRLRVPARVRGLRRRHARGPPAEHAAAGVVHPELSRSPTAARTGTAATWWLWPPTSGSAPLAGRLQGVLARPLAREHYAMCGTAEPGTPDFHRVICSAAHSWRAFATVDVPGKRYPGVEAVRAAGQQTCRDAASASPTTRSTTAGATSGRRSSSGRPASTRASAGPPTDTDSSVLVSGGSHGNPQTNRCGAASEAELAQLLGVALPVLGDLDVQVEVDRRAEQGLDLLAGPVPTSRSRAPLWPMTMPFWEDRST